MESRTLPFITIHFANKVIAHLNVNWLSPVKVRSTLIGAEKKMLVWNDLESDEKIKIYDKGVERSSGLGDHALRVIHRAGDIGCRNWNRSRLSHAKRKYFIDCIMNNHTPINDGLSGLRVVQMLEAVDRSMAQRGGMVYCKPTSTKGVATETTVTFG
jgi:hypothetical protein